MITQRLEKYIIADDVQVVDASPHYGLLSAQGPKAEAVVQKSWFAFWKFPAKPSHHFTSVNDATLGEMYLVNQPRTGRIGFDGLFVPTHSLGAVFDKMILAAREIVRPRLRLAGA